jgi:hypothetical protein
MLQRTPADLLRPRSNTLSRATLTQRFRSAWRAGVAGIIKAGQVLLDGKEQLEHGAFLDWVEHDLKLGERKAQCLMLVAKHPVISNPHHWCAFPPSWRTLVELSYLCRPGQNPQRMLALIKSGKINPFMTREEASALLRGRRQEAEQLILSTDLSRVLRLLNKLTLEQAIANLRSDPGAATPDTLAQLGRKLLKVAKHWRETD